MDTSYYIEGLLRQANAAYARKYLGLGNTDVVNFGYVVNNTPLWNDIRIPLASTRQGAGGNAPVASVLRGGAYAYRWDNAGNIRTLQWEMQLPHGFNEDAAYGFRLHVHWTAGNITSPNSVEWNVEVAVADLGGVFPVATNTYTAAGMTTAAFEHVYTPLHTFTGLHESAMIVGTLWRSIGGGDTYAGNDVFGLSLDAHYAFQKAGSLLETGD